MSSKDPFDFDGIWKNKDYLVEIKKSELDHLKAMNIMFGFMLGFISAFALAALVIKYLPV